MVDLHTMMGLDNLITGEKGTGPIHARRTFNMPNMPVFDRQPAQNPNQYELAEQLKAIQESAYDSDPTGNLEILRSTNG